MSNLVIGEGTEVTLHFALRLETDEVVDSNFDTAPATFTVGDGNLLPGFERVLFGMAAGQVGTFKIPPEQGFGVANPNNVQVLKRSQFSPDVNLEIGLMMSFADAQNAELPGVIKDFDEQEVTIDFNHPLAGHTILFDVEIISVNPAIRH